MEKVLLLIMILCWYSLYKMLSLIHLLLHFNLLSNVISMSQMLLVLQVTITGM